LHDNCRIIGMEAYKLNKTTERARLLLLLGRKEGSYMYSMRERETFYLDELRAGMVTAEPVLDRGGNRLLNSDITLDDSKISRLRARGVATVRVKREEGNLKPEVH